VRFPSYLILFFLSNSLFDSTLYFGERSLTADSLTVVRSKNEGLTWNPILNLHSLFSKADMLAHGDTLILATSRSNVAGNDCGIYHSTDHGATWKQVLASVNVNALTQDESHPEIMYAATQNGIYRSLNAGMNWHLFNNTLPTNNLVDILQDSCSDIIYVASDLGVYKVLDSVVRVSENERLKTPAQFSLHQNYPNPFNTATLIEYKVTRPVEVSITIYDAMGKEVQQLVSSSHAPGFYRLRFESYHLASGIYYYTMRAGSFSETKQMTISK